MRIIRLAVVTLIAGHAGAQDGGQKFDYDAWQ